MDTLLMERTMQSRAEPADRCEECGQEITNTSNLNPHQYAAFMRFLCFWLRLPERSRDIIAKMIVTPGLTPPEYCPEVTERHAYRLVSDAKEQLREIMEMDAANM